MMMYCHLTFQNLTAIIDWDNKLDDSMFLMVYIHFKNKLN